MSTIIVDSDYTTKPKILVKLNGITFRGHTIMELSPEEAEILRYGLEVALQDISYSMGEGEEELP